MMLHNKLSYLSKFKHGFKSRTVVNLSTLSNLSKKSNKPRETQVKKTDQETAKSFTSLFNEITHLLGSGDLTPDKFPSGLSTSNEYSYCAQSVCRNADEVMVTKTDSLLTSENTQLEKLSERDVSPIVHEITEIVRGENGTISMEERLEQSGLMFDAEIVEKVLKRCFKVPHLAFRFFNWVKFKDGFSHTTDTYNIMVSIVGEAKEYWLVDKLLEKMETSKCKRNIKTWTILISIYGKAKSISKALTIFEDMGKFGCEPDEKTYRMMVRLLCNAQKPDIAMEFYKEMGEREWGLDVNSYKLLMNSLARSGDTSAVHLVADGMMKVSQIPEQDVFSCMLKSFCISGNIREALEIIRDFKKKNLTLDLEHFETLVRGLCKADRIDDAMEIVDIMKKRHVVDGNVYEIIINGYLKKNKVSTALNLYRNMKNSDISPTASTYTELMQHLFKSKEYSEGNELCKEMLESGIELDSVAMTAVVAGHVCQNRVTEAWKVLKDMEEKGIKATHKFYVIFIKELCKISRTDEVFKVINKMRASRVIIGDEIFHWVISYLVKYGAKNVMVEKIKELQRTCKLSPHRLVESNINIPEIHEDLNVEINMRGQPQGFSFPGAGPLNSKEIVQHRVPPNLVQPQQEAYYSELDLQEICAILSSSRDWSAVQEDLEKCTVQFKPDLVVQIMRHSALHGALGFFSWLGKHADYNHNTETYNMAIKIAGCGKDFTHMRSLFFEMRRKGYPVTPDTWTIMIMQYARAGLTEIALKCFEDMKSNSCKPSGSTFKYLIILLCGKKGRKLNEAIETFQEMLRAKHVPDKEMVEIYMQCLCEEGKLLVAEKCVQSLIKVGFTVPLSYSMYARALCRAGKLDEVLALLDEVGPAQPKLDEYIYGSLVHGLLQKGRLEDALAKVNCMKQAGIKPTVHVYTSFIVHYFKAKQVEKALELFKNMQEEGCEPTIVTYSALIRGYMDTENFYDARNLFNHMKIKGPLPDFKAYSMFIACLCKVGKSEEAMGVISEMLECDIAPSSVNFRTVVFGLNREGKHDLARLVVQQKSNLKDKRMFST